MMRVVLFLRITALIPLVSFSAYQKNLICKVVHAGKKSFSSVNNKECFMMGTGRNSFAATCNMI